MKIPNLEFLKSVRSGEPIPDGFGARLFEALRAIGSQSSTTEQQGNTNPQGQPTPPPAPNGINVAAKDGHHTVTISDQNPGVKRGVNYWLERDTSPNFSNPHIIDLGQSRNHSEFLGNGTYYWRGYSSYGASPASKPVYHGSEVQPTAVNAGGLIGAPAVLESQGSGTGAPREGLVGPGPVPVRTDTQISAWAAQGSTEGGFSFIPPSSTAGPSGGSGGGGSASLTEGAIASCEWLTSVAGTNTVTAKTSVAYSSLSSGFLVRFVPANTNSGAVTLNVNAIGAKAVTKNGSAALVGGELVAGKTYVLIYDGTRWQVVGIFAPASATVLASDANGVPTAAPLTKGSAWVGNGSNLPVALAAGSNGQVLTANSAATNGVDYEAPIALTTTGTSGAASLTPGTPYSLNIPNYSASGATGTWTPGVQFNGGTTGITYTLQVGNYFSIGGMVFAYFDVTLSSKGSDTGFTEITGLPVSVSATIIATGALTFMQNMSGIQATPSALPSAGTNRARLLDFSATDGVNVTDTNFTNTSRIVGMVIYYS